MEKLSVLSLSASNRNTRSVIERRSQTRSDSEGFNRYSGVGNIAATTVRTDSLGSYIQPSFSQPVLDGTSPRNKVRGRGDTKIAAEDMILPQDQALLEWHNIEFFVPSKQPPPSAIT